MTVLETQGLAARHAARALAVAGTARKNAALEAAARTIEARQGEILAANAADLEAAMAAGLRPALLDRLALDEGRIAGIVEGVRQVAALPDPIGAVTKMDTRPNGLTIGKRRVPLGVIGIIYEARPNVTVDAAALCLKSGNAALLRGGKEAFHSNQAFAAVLRDALEEAGLPRDCVALVADTSRESANELMGLTEYLDVLIPRGGAGLIRSVVENARVPVIQTGVGVCHIYVHERADLDMAARILYNAKTSRPSVCNAAECVLVDRAAARDFLPLAWELLQTKGVELRGCPETRAILGDWVKPAAEADWDTQRGGERPGAGHPDWRGGVPHLRPREGRPGHGSPHPLQRQDLPPLGVQRRRVRAGGPGSGAGLPAPGVGAAPNQGRGAEGLPGNPGHPGGLGQARR